MHEILFRGKRVDNGEWVDGCLATYPDGKARIFKTSSGGNCHNGLFDVIPETIGQFTGLTDKNGRKIFEGDIVRNGYSSKLGEFWDIGNVVYVTTDGCFEICNFNESYLKRLTQTQIIKRTIEVIGNIHDNPELLESEVKE